MELSKISLTQGAPLQEGTGQRHVVSPVELVPGRRVFRHVSYVRFSGDGVADRIVLDASLSAFNVSFRSYEYNALAAGMTDLQAAVETFDGTVVVTLDAPRSVQKVRVDSSKISGTGYMVGLFRLDGSRLADAPTVSAENDATLGSPFVDARFGVRLKHPTDAYDTSLVASDLKEVTVCGEPATVLLGLAAPVGLSSPQYFWTGTRAGGLEKVDVGTALAAALQRHLDSLAPPLPAHVDVAIVADSDAPCILNVAAFCLTYHLAVETFRNGGQRDPNKRVLRFPGGNTARESVCVRLPARASLVSGDMRVDVSFSKDRPAGAAPASAGGVAQGKEGIFVGQERWAAQPLSPQKAISVTGAALDLMGLAAKTEVLVELREDWRGQPLGKALARGMAALAQAGTQGAATVAFPKAVVLPAGTCWLVARAAKGRALWLTAPGEGAVRLLHATGKSGLACEAGSVDGVRALCQLVSKTGAEEAPPLTASISGNAVPAKATAAGFQALDLTAALAAHLASLPGDGVRDIEVSFETALRGVATVGPPLILYDLSP